jgi:hypothetical protein
MAKDQPAIRKPSLYYVMLAVMYAAFILVASGEV